jgi:SPP1 gp7 family putative phage head morphogenesis protein
MELVELEDDPMIDFLEAGNFAMSGFEARELMAKHLELVGEAFAWKERNPVGMPIRMWPLVPTWVREVPLHPDDPFVVQFQGKVIKIPQSEILRVKISDPFSPYGRGVGIGMSLADEIDTDEYAAALARAFFYNDATPSGVVMFDDMGDDEVEQFEEKWRQSHRGAERGYMWHILNQKADITVFDKSFKDIELVELRKFLRSVARETWGIPPEIVGVIENSNRATIDAAGYIFAKQLIVPRCERWRDALQNQVAPDFDDRKIVGYVSPIPQDNEAILEARKAMPLTLTVNEWRDSQNADPVEGGDVLLADVQRANQPQLPPPPPADEEDEGEEVESKRYKMVAELKNSDIAPTDIDEILKAIDADVLRDHAVPVMEDGLAAWGNEVLTDLAALSGKSKTKAIKAETELAFDMLDPEMVEFVDEFSAQQVTFVNETTRVAIREALVAGVEALERRELLAKRITEVFSQASKQRALTIARTETARAANVATWRAQFQSGVVDLREWVATPDGRVREPHIGLDGIVVGISEPWTFSDGVEVIAPGNSGEAKHDINCRCTTIAAIEDVEIEADFRAAYWKAFDEGVTIWERQVERAFVQGFADQETSTLEALDAAIARRGRS